MALHTEGARITRVMIPVVVIPNRLLFSGSSTPLRGGAWVPTQLFRFWVKMPAPGGGGVRGPQGPVKLFETFCMGVDKFLGLGGSKYRLPPGG